jgi:2-C-methyl-D-erythritol 4-phosphate cytidylyltransferase
MVVCVLPKSHVGDPPPWLFQSDLDRLLISVGGRDRTQSVRNGLEDLPPEVQYVAVHDAARPLVEPDTVERVIAQARAGTGAIAAIPASDTLKEVAADGRVERTIDRSAIWRVQTPQAFPRAMIDDVYRRAAQDRVSATDDAALCERYGYPVVVVRGSEMGMKVTEESDFAVLEALAAAREART